MNNTFNICLVSCVMAHCAFAVNVPKELETFYHTAISNSTLVCVSSGKIKTDYKILEVTKTSGDIIYTVADIPMKGFRAQIHYYTKHLEEGRKKIRELPELKYPSPPALREERAALINDIREQYTVPFPFPSSAKCVHIETGDVIEFYIDQKTGHMLTYRHYYDEDTQREIMEFWPNKQIGEYKKIHNNKYAGMEYEIDEAGNITKTVDHGPPPAERRPFDRETWPKVEFVK